MNPHSANPNPNVAPKVPLRGILSELVAYALTGQSIRATIEIRGMSVEFNAVLDGTTEDAVNYFADEADGCDAVGAQPDEGGPADNPRLPDRACQGRYSRGCALGVLLLLSQASRRLAQSEVIDRLRLTGGYWGTTVIRETLAGLVDFKLLTNTRHDELGCGYWLTLLGQQVLTHEQSQPPADGREADTFTTQETAP